MNLSHSTEMILNGRKNGHTLNEISGKHGDCQDEL